MQLLISSFGKFSGYVSATVNADGITAQRMPETATCALMALGRVAMGATVRRRKA